MCDVHTFISSNSFAISESLLWLSLSSQKSSPACCLSRLEPLCQAYCNLTCQHFAASRSSRSCDAREVEYRQFSNIDGSSAVRASTRCTVQKYSKGTLVSCCKSDRKQMKTAAKYGNMPYRNLRVGKTVVWNSRIDQVAESSGWDHGSSSHLGAWLWSTRKAWSAGPTKLPVIRIALSIASQR